MTSEPRRRGICDFGNDAGLTVYTAMLILLALVATIENLIVIIVIGKNRSLQKPSIILLGILAGVDFITGTVVIPIHVVMINTWVSRDFRKNSVFMFLVVMFFSLSTVLAISVDRFLHALRLDRYELTTKKLVFGLLLFWAVPLIITLSLALEHYWDGLPWLMLSFFLFCLCGMIFAYIGMVLALAAHMRRAGDNTAMQAMIGNERQAVRTTLIIICACVLLNIPPVATIVLAFMGNSNNIFCATTVFVLLANSAVNPMIYCLRMPSIRKHVFFLFTKCGKTEVEVVQAEGSESSHILRWDGGCEPDTPCASDTHL